MNFFIRGMSLCKLRLRMVRRTFEVGISQIAQPFKTTAKTVRKWMKRDEGKRIGRVKEYFQSTAHTA